jgi:8-oxo-dGTP diphosphatase
MTAAAAPKLRARTARATRTAAYSVDVVLLTPADGQLAAVLVRAPAVRSGEARPRERWALPWDPGQADDVLADRAAAIARAVIGVEPAWMEQIGAFGDGRRHPSGAEISVAFLGLLPVGTELPAASDAEFLPLSELPQVAPRQRAMLDGAFALLRSRAQQAPVAIRLLPPTFTLSELQEMYELLLDRRLHKASFRRSLQAARIVEPTDEWRSEGRGRPAQLFRYAPKKRRSAPRGVRFE